MGRGEFGGMESREEPLPLSGDFVPFSGDHGPPCHQPVSLPWAWCARSQLITG